jgi:peptide-methionine (S)-S-oxide reductase
VVRTRVGYSGGTTKNPTYHNLGDQSESVQIDYDPAQISYKELLAVFWEAHAPGAPAISRQYQAAVFYHNAKQRRLALETKARVAAKIKGEVFTQILPASTFYPAEDYHQKYYLRQQPELLRELSAVYPAVPDFINSTAAARLNGYVAGFGSREKLLEEIDRLGLSPAGRKRLLALVPAPGAGAKPAQLCPVGH